MPHHCSRTVDELIRDRMFNCAFNINLLLYTVCMYFNMEDTGESLVEGDQDRGEKGRREGKNHKRNKKYMGALREVNNELHGAVC